MYAYSHLRFERSKQMDNHIKPSDYKSFGEYIKDQREFLGKSIRGLAAELEMTPAYLSDIEKGNRNAPKNYLEKIIKVMLISDEYIYDFYDLAGESRYDYSDIFPYIKDEPLARLALRKARDKRISADQWKKFINDLDEIK